MNKRWWKMSACLIFCIFISFSDSYKLSVKKYSTVEIGCQFTINENDNVSWYFEESNLIAIRKDVNPKLKSKFKINGNLKLQILNFTEADQGRYMCQGLSSGKYQQYTVMLKLCTTPDTYSDFAFVPDKNSRNRDDVHETNIICMKDNIAQLDGKDNLKTLMNIVTRPASKYNRITDRKEKTEHEKLMKYKCLALIKEQCVKNNKTFQLQVEWILSDEEEYTRETPDVEDTYTCKCNSSKMAENLYCNGTVHTYFSNKTMFLQYLKNSTAALYKCETDSNDVLRIPIPSSDIEAKPLYLVYLLMSVSIVCAIPLVSILLWCVRRMPSNHQNATNPPESLHSQVPDDREYGSVDNEYEEIDSVSYHSVIWRNYGFENTNRLNPESERISEKPISSSSGSSITLFHFYVNTSIDSTNIMPTRNENELNHQSQLGTSDIGNNNSHSNNSSESGKPEVNQYMNVFPNAYEDLKHLSGDTHKYETLV